MAKAKHKIEVSTKKRVGFPRMMAPIPPAPRSRYKKVVKKVKQPKLTGLQFKKLKKGVYWQWWKNGLCVAQSTISYRTEGWAKRGYATTKKDMNKSPVA